MRSLLLTSCRDDAALEAASASAADAILLDLEAIAAPSERERGRQRVAAFLARARLNASRPRMIIRVAAIDDAAIEADLDAVMPAAPDAVAPKSCRGGADLERLGVKLAVREAESGLADGAVRILALVATSAAALFGLASIPQRSARLSALAWDAEALLADLRAEPPYGAGRRRQGSARLARDLALIAAVAAGAAPIDAAFPWTNDPAGLRVEALEGRRDGFAGKIAVDPGQVALINEIFSR